MMFRRTIREKAERRFQQGYPPRKKTDTSMGDAFNGEWMIYCASKHQAELVIITRDSDFGLMIDNKGYPNDALQQEFKERVSKDLNVVLFPSLTEGLKHLDVTVSQEELDAEVLLRRLRRRRRSYRRLKNYRTFLTTVQPPQTDPLEDDANTT
jgi:hypothetical protein